MKKRMLTINEFVELYGIGRTKTYQEIKSARLKALKCGRRTLIPLEAAEDWLCSLKQVSNS